MRRELWRRRTGEGASTLIVRVVRWTAERIEAAEEPAGGARHVGVASSGRVLMSRAQAAVGDVWEAPSGRCWQVSEVDAGDGCRRVVEVGVVGARLRQSPPRVVS